MHFQLDLTCCKPWSTCYTISASTRTQFLLKSMENFFEQDSSQKTNRVSVFLAGGHPTIEVAVFQYTRQIFESKCWPTCANYALQRTTTDSQSEFPEAVESFCNIFYVDDYLESSQVVGEAITEAQDLVKLLTLGEFTLTVFMKNVPSISFQIELDCKSPGIDIEMLPTITDSSHVLDLLRNHRVDTLAVSCCTTSDSNAVFTQRVVLICLVSV